MPVANAQCRLGACAALLSRPGGSRKDSSNVTSSIPSYSQVSTSSRPVGPRLGVVQNTRNTASALFSMHLFTNLPLASLLCSQLTSWHVLYRAISMNARDEVYICKEMSIHLEFTSDECEHSHDARSSCRTRQPSAPYQHSTRETPHGDTSQHLSAHFAHQPTPKTRQAPTPLFLGKGGTLLYSSDT